MSRSNAPILGPMKNPTGSSLALGRMTREERLMRLVDKTDKCWLWRGGLSPKGYGTIRIKGKPYRAHRLSYELFKGSPKDMKVLHTCDVPRCVNPAHLWLGTDTENIADRDAKGRAAKGETCHLSKLTEAEVLEIRAMKEREPGLTYARIGARFGIVAGTVHQIIRRKTWRHV